MQSGYFHVFIGRRELTKKRELLLKIDFSTDTTIVLEVLYKALLKSLNTIQVWNTVVNSS